MTVIKSFPDYAFNGARSLACYFTPASGVFIVKRVINDVVEGYDVAVNYHMEQDLIDAALSNHRSLCGTLAYDAHYSHELPRLKLVSVKI